MITGTDRGLLIIIIKKTLGSYQLERLKENIVDFVEQYKFGALSAGVIQDDDSERI